jgi:hypothetical protein
MTKPEVLMFFQIHKDGHAVDGSSYPSLEEAAMALEKEEQGGEVTEVDESDNVVRRYSVQESRTAARNRRHEMPGSTFRKDN